MYFPGLCIGPIFCPTEAAAHHAQLPQRRQRAGGADAPEHSHRVPARRLPLDARQRRHETAECGGARAPGAGCRRASGGRVVGQRQRRRRQNDLVRGDRQARSARNASGDAAGVSQVSRAVRAAASSCRWSVGGRWSVTREAWVLY